MMQVFEISNNCNLFYRLYIVDICTAGLFFNPVILFVFICYFLFRTCMSQVVAPMIAFDLHGCIFISTDYSGVGPLCTLQVPGVFCGARPISTRALVEGRIGFKHPSLCPHTVWSWTKDVCRLCYVNTTTYS